MNTGDAAASKNPVLAFDLQPTLTGRLVELRPLTAQDYAALYDAAKDPAIWEQHPERDRYIPDVFRRYFDGAIASGGAFAVIDRQSGRMIGSSRYCDLRPDQRQVEIGWTFLERAYWGGDYNREMKSLMLDHAFRFVDRVVFVVGENNVRSRRAVEKIGATFLETTVTKTEDGAQRRNVVYAIQRRRRSRRTE